MLRCVSIWGAALWLWPSVALGAVSVGRIDIKGPIGPATADYISRAIDLAADRDFQCLIIQLDTPGGLLDSTKQIVQDFFRGRDPDSGLCRARRSHGYERWLLHHPGRPRGGDGALH